MVAFGAQTGGQRLLACGVLEVRPNVSHKRMFLSSTFSCIAVASRGKCDVLGSPKFYSFFLFLFKLKLGPFGATILSFGTSSILRACCELLCLIETKLMLYFLGGSSGF